jgi:hypothetical protein
MAVRVDDDVHIVGVDERPGSPIEIRVGEVPKRGMTYPDGAGDLLRLASKPGPPAFGAIWEAYSLRYLIHPLGQLLL